MAFGKLEGNREFLWFWEGANHGWGTRIMHVPNYAAGMQRWRARLTQTRDTVSFDDADKALITAIDAAGTVVDDTFALCGRLDSEAYATLFTGVCKDYSWENGVLEMSIANRFEELRSGRFQSNYRDLRYYTMDKLQVAALNGTEVLLNGSVVLNRGGAVVYDSGPSDDVFLATNSILVFSSVADPSTIDDPWEFAIAGFPHLEDENFATSIAMRLSIDTAAGIGNYVYAPEDKLFVGSPQSLIREFLGGTSTDVGWTEGDDFVLGTTDVLDQVELRVPVSYRANSDASVLSVLDHICETTLISAWPDREAVVHFVPHTQIDLALPSDGTLSRETGFKNLRYGYDSDDIVTTIELYFGYDSDANSALDEWGGHKTFEVPAHWPGQTGVERTSSMKAKYFFHPDTARAMSLRVLGRHFKGVPQLELDCLPTAATVTIGDIETIYFTLLDVNGAYYEVASIQDGWENDGIRVVLQAGTSLYDLLGFGEWEDSPWSDHAVSGTSTLGWGEGTLGDDALGTCNGIDVGRYGTVFRWGG
ncbi:MAG: hypothetical protein KOO60_11040 [Gemmatimonadales bacterium]|nr:hypothetical protein [Gemmatimonadales bacterium]